MSDRNSLRKVYTNYEFYSALLHFLGESQTDSFDALNFLNTN